MQDKVTTYWLITVPLKGWKSSNIWEPYLLTHSTEQSPSWEANRFSVSEEIPRISWNAMVRYRVHKYMPLVPILSQLDPIHTPTSYFLKIHLNIILPSMPGSLSLRFPHQKPEYTSPLPHTRYMSRPPHSSWFYHPNNIGWGVQTIQLLIMLFPSLPYRLFPPRPKYSPQHPILKHPQPAFLKVSHPYKRQAKLNFSIS